MKQIPLNQLIKNLVEKRCDGISYTYKYAFSYNQKFELIKRDANVSMYFDTNYTLTKDIFFRYMNNSHWDS